MLTWLITGISRGLGRALAEAALIRGDTVIGTVRDDQTDLPSASRLRVLRFDITDPSAARSTVAEAFALAGRVDVVVNNAGFGLLGPVEDVTAEEIKHLFEVNLFGPVRVIQAALPRLRVQGSGHLINITSIAGRDPMAGSGLYAAAKAGLEALSQALASEVAPFGLRVTAVAPGSFRTDFLTPHSIRRTAGGAGAYAASVGKALQHLDHIAGRQAGDPARAAAAIIEIVTSGNPPGNLLLGSDALRRVRTRIENMNLEAETWAQLSRSTDHGEDVPA